MKDHLDSLKKEVLSLGDETQCFIYAKFDREGKLVWRYAGSLQDVCFLLKNLDLRIGEEVAKALSIQK
jgi:hypothetical protein